MDSENILEEEFAAARAVGASVIEHWFHRCIRHRRGIVWLMALLLAMIAIIPDDRVPRLIFKFQTGRLETHLDGQYSTDLRLIFEFFSHLFAQSIAGAHTRKKI